MLKINELFFNYEKPSEHAKYSPSSADRWLSFGCPYSIRAAQNVPPEPERSYAIEGTLAHELCEAVFYLRANGTAIPPELLVQVGAQPDQGAEMFIAANSYVDDVVAYWCNNKEFIGDVLYMGAEKGIPIFPDKSCFGTADFVVIGTKGAAIIDFKYGRKPVKADALQLKVYSAGVLRWLENPPVGYQVAAVIYQPRHTDIPKEHIYTGLEIFDFLSVIWGSILECEKDDLEPKEGNHCFWCALNRTKDLRYKCPIKKDKPMALVKSRFEEFLSQTHKGKDLVGSTPERDQAMIKVLKFVDAVNDVAKQATEEFEERIRSGEVVPGVKLSEVKGKRQVIGANDAEKASTLTEKFPHLDPYKIETKKTIRALGDMEKEVGKNKLDVCCVQKITQKVELTNDNIFEDVNHLQGFAKIL